MSSKFMYYLQENWKRLWIITLWILIMIGLFLWKYYQYKQRAAFEVMGYCVLTAKGAAETLKFNMAIILLPVCRNTITWLRSTKLSNFVPFDDNINFHKVQFCYPSTCIVALILFNFRIMKLYLSVNGYTIDFSDDSCSDCDRGNPSCW